VAKKEDASLVKEAVSEVREEVKESVQETVSAWKRVLRPRVIITTIAFILLILLLWLGLKLHATITEDLVITLTPTTAALVLPHSTAGEARFSLQTNNYLFCEARCALLVTDENKRIPYYEEQEIILADSSKNISLSFPAREKGVGQELYSLEITCTNQQRFLCNREEKEHRASALITVDYTLTAEEQEAKRRAEAMLPNFLEDAYQLDLLTQEARAYTLHLDPEERGLDGLGKESARLRSLALEKGSTAEQFAALWTSESYLQLAVENISSDVDAAARVNIDIISYVTAQHKLVEAIDSVDEAAVTLALQSFVAAGDQEAENRLLTAYRTLSMADPRYNASSQEPSASNASKEIPPLIEESVNILNEELLLSNRLLNKSGEEGNELESVWSKVNESCAKLERVANKTRTMTEFLDRCQRRAIPYELILLRTFEKATLPALVNISSDFPRELTANLELCCFRDQCYECAPPDRAPILFLHGHSMNERNAPEYSLNAFTRIQERLHDKGLFIDAGAMTPFDATEPFPLEAWGKQVLPVSVRGTYYFDSYLKGESYILSAAKSESIDTYAIRVRDLVETLRARTGSEKVTIVAHSMGGLVARRYMQLFGPAHVEQLIMMGTPNYGVESSVADLCPVIGADKECKELTKGSAMLAKLNDPNKQPDVEMAIIYGVGCDMDGMAGDGIVLQESALIEGVPRIEIEGNCPTVGRLHTDMVLPAEYPAAYEALVSLLA
jgi:predicted alpha/beta hydrolase family esterase